MSGPEPAHQPDASVGARGLPAWVWMVTAAAAAGVAGVTVHSREKTPDVAGRPGPQEGVIAREPA